MRVPAKSQDTLPFPTLVAPACARGASLQERFEAFHQANPWVLVELERMTGELVAAGRGRVGIGMLFEVLRWEHHRRTTGVEFKLNNSHRSRYVRLIVERHPEWRDVFELRGLRAA